MLREKELKATSGMFALLTGLAVLSLSVLGLVRGAQGESAVLIVTSAVVMFVAITLMAGLFTVNPNDAKVLTLFGRYVGTVRDAGLWFANPFYAKKRISLRVRNFETTKL
jgi:regulator of protease activity HflC (stomatin/prohibitin superfamily)